MCFDLPLLLYSFILCLQVLRAWDETPAHTYCPEINCYNTLQIYNMNIFQTFHLSEKPTCLHAVLPNACCCIAELYTGKALLWFIGVAHFLCVFTRLRVQPKILFWHHNVNHWSQNEPCDLPEFAFQTDGTMLYSSIFIQSP